MKPVSAGIIGTGDIVISSHLPVLLAMRSVRVAWILDVDTSRCATVGKAYRVPAIKMPEPLANLPEADVVLIATPYGVRRPYYDVLRQRQTAVYVEKPLARTAAEHAEFCSWFPEYSFACGLQRRCFGPTQVAREVTRSSLFGKLRSMRFGLGRRGRIGSGGFLSNPKLSGGGRLIEEGIHGVDALLFITEARTAQVDRASIIWDDSYDLHTDADLRVETGDGTVVEAHVSVSYLQDTIERVELAYERGTISFSLFSTKDVSVMAETNGSRYNLIPDGGRYPKTNLETAHEYWSYFLTGLADRKANWTSAAASILTTQVIEEIYKKGGRPIDADDVQFWRPATV
jgi:predicted dehydrogenase